MRNYNIQALYHNYLYMEPLFYTIIKLYKKPIKKCKHFTQQYIQTPNQGISQTKTNFILKNIHVNL